jgi:hypothetical protein
MSTSLKDGLGLDGFTPFKSEKKPLLYPAGKCKYMDGTGSILHVRDCVTSWVVAFRSIF